MLNDRSLGLSSCYVMLLSKKTLSVYETAKTCIYCLKIILKTIYTCLQLRDQTQTDFQNVSRAQVHAERSRPFSARPIRARHVIRTPGLKRLTANQKQGRNRAGVHPAYRNPDTGLTNEHAPRTSASGSHSPGRGKVRTSSACKTPS